MLRAELFPPPVPTALVEQVQEVYERLAAGEALPHATSSPTSSSPATS
jgi:hypothetical protein